MDEEKDKESAVPPGDDKELLRDIIREDRKGRGWVFFLIGGLAIVIIAVVVYLVQGFIRVKLGDEDKADLLKEETIGAEGEEVVPIQRPIMEAGMVKEEYQLSVVSWQDGDPDIWLVNLSGSYLRRLTISSDEESQLRWSPDGNDLCYMEWDRTNEVGNIFVIDLEEKKRRLLSPGSNPIWSPDGGSISFFDGGVLKSMDYSTGRTLNLSPQESPLLAGDDLPMPSWSMDGRYMAYLIPLSPEESPSPPTGEPSMLEYSLFIFEGESGIITDLSSKLELGNTTCFAWRP